MQKGLISFRREICRVTDNRLTNAKNQILEISCLCIVCFFFLHEMDKIGKWEKSCIFKEFKL